MGPITSNLCKTVISIIYNFLLHRVLTNQHKLNDCYILKSHLSVWFVENLISTN